MSVLPAGYEHGVAGPVEVSRWCPACGEFALAHERTGLCMWCDGPTVAATEAPPIERKTVVEDVTCKIDGCNQLEEQHYGKYGRLCLNHRAEAVEANGGTAPATRPVVADGEFLKRVRALGGPARALDKAKRKLSAVSTNEELQAEFAEASRRATATATAENLERLANAVGALRRDAPKRQQAQSTYDDAERQFKLALGAIAKDLRAA